ncbi:MAG: hypothetical protein KDD52_09575 [Bdellovibrionales bacterium]|nr:hypothetical protein [Bdellovibrionales bacterium]
MSGSKKILILNSLQSYHGSTARLRAISETLENLGHQIVFHQPTTNALRRMFSSMKTCLHGDYEILWTQKLNPITLPSMLIARLRSKLVIVDWDDWDTGLQQNIVFAFLSYICETLGHWIPNLITSHSYRLLKKVSRTTPTHYLRQALPSPQTSTPSFQDKTNLETAYRHILGWRQQKDINITAYLCTMTSGGAMDLPYILQEWSKHHAVNQNHLLVIGGGPKLLAMITLAKKLSLEGKVFFAGWISSSDLPQLLSQLDDGLIYMSDTKSNQLRVSLKILHYMNAGIPIWGNVVGETKEQYGQWIANCHIADKGMSFHSPERISLDLHTKELKKDIESLIANHPTWFS